MTAEINRRDRIRNAKEVPDRLTVRLRAAFMRVAVRAAIIAATVEEMADRMVSEVRRDREVLAMARADKNRLIDRMARVTPMEAAEAVMADLRRAGRAVSAARALRDLTVIMNALKEAMEGRTLDLEESLSQEALRLLPRHRSRNRKSTVMRKSAALRKISGTKKN